MTADSMAVRVVFLALTGWVNRQHQQVLEYLVEENRVLCPTTAHVPTGQLAMLAQRLGRVIESPTTWYRLVRKHGGRRPRLRIHPEKPTEGIRASKPNEIWHVDTTVIRLLDGTRAYLHAVIDNFSRCIFAWRVHDRFDAGNTAAVLIEAGRAVERSESRPTVLADGGVENHNGAVDKLVSSGMLLWRDGIILPLRNAEQERPAVRSQPSRSRQESDDERGGRS